MPRGGVPPASSSSCSNRRRQSGRGREATAEWVDHDSVQAIQQRDGEQPLTPGRYEQPQHYGHPAGRGGAFRRGTDLRNDMPVSYPPPPPADEEFVEQPHPSTRQQNNDSDGDEAEPYYPVEERPVSTPWQLRGKPQLQQQQQQQEKQRRGDQSSQYGSTALYQRVTNRAAAHGDFDSEDEPDENFQYVPREQRVIREREEEEVLQMSDADAEGEYYPHERLHDSEQKNGDLRTPDVHHHFGAASPSSSSKMSTTTSSSTDSAQSEDEEEEITALEDVLQLILQYEEYKRQQVDTLPLRHPDRAPFASSRGVSQTSLRTGSVASAVSDAPLQQLQKSRSSSSVAAPEDNATGERVHHHHRQQQQHDSSPVADETPSRFEDQPRNDGHGRSSTPKTSRSLGRQRHNATPLLHIHSSTLDPYVGRVAEGAKSEEDLPEWIHDYQLSKEERQLMRDGKLGGKLSRNHSRTSAHADPSISSSQQQDNNNNYPSPSSLQQTNDQDRYHESAPNTGRHSAASVPYTRETSRFTATSSKSAAVHDSFLSEAERQERSLRRRQKVEAEVAAQRTFTPRLSRAGTPRKHHEAPLSRPGNWEDRLYNEYFSQKMQRQEEHLLRMQAVGERDDIEAYVRHCSFKPDLSCTSEYQFQREPSDTHIGVKMFENAKHYQDEKREERKQIEEEKEAEDERVRAAKVSAEAPQLRIYEDGIRHKQQVEEKREARIKGMRKTVLRSKEEIEQKALSLHEEKEYLEEKRRETAENIARRVGQQTTFTPEITEYARFHSDGTPAHERLYAKHQARQEQERKKRIEQSEETTNLLCARSPSGTTRRSSNASSSSPAYRQ